MEQMFRYIAHIDGLGLVVPYRLSCRFLLNAIDVSLFHNMRPPHCSLNARYKTALLPCMHSFQNHIYTITAYHPQPIPHTNPTPQTNKQPPLNLLPPSSPILDFPSRTLSFSLKTPVVPHSRHLPIQTMLRREKCSVVMLCLPLRRGWWWGHVLVK